MPARRAPQAGSPPAGVARILLTASGGPFLRTRREDLASVTPEQAVAHPNWRMGPKISVDSATLMNKGLELIEACHLFAVAPDAVRVVIHPQSIVHSLVEFDDGSVLAQMSRARHARADRARARLAGAHRLGGGATRPRARLRGCRSKTLILKGFLACDSRKPRPGPGGTMPAVLNAANEVAVAAFLGRRLNFAGIAAVIE